ncbi:Fe2+-dependent dioxygenase [Thiomicrorhabdus cannonii]|uniref:Fe2+-dependent dioxygenase n=1 Tax=Thiomicrorhabdus cannonii TaxID=2748011 RepID=UPI0015BE36EB
MKVFNVLNARQVEQLREFINGLQFEDGKATARGSAREIKENFQILETNPQAQPLFNDIRKLFMGHDALAGYTFAKEIVSPRVASYKQGGYYGWHVDMAIMNRKRTDMSFTLALTDDYEGGELEFDYGEYKTKVRLKKGQMVVYPTGVLHQVNPVISGERLVIVGWVQSIIPNQADREAIIRFTSEIQRLKQLVETPSELNQLSYLLQYFKRKLANG